VTINFIHESFFVCFVAPDLEAELGLSFLRDNENVRESNIFFNFAKESFLILFVLSHCHIPVDKMQSALLILVKVISILEHFDCFVKNLF